MEEDNFWHKLTTNKIDRLRVKQIQNNFSISFVEALELFNRSQLENCEICGKSKKENEKELAIDHCHISGKIRGLLCSTCNSGIGLLRDDINILKKATEYLEKHT